MIKPFGFYMTELIGCENSGVVYKCIHRESKRIVAMKFFKNREEFDKELLIHELLTNPYIVGYIGYCIDEKKRKFIIITELASKGSLYKKLLSKNGLKYANKREISLDLANAILYMHSHNIVHHDIKPRNILFDKKQKVKLTGFGVSSVLNTPMCNVSVTSGLKAPEVTTENVNDFKSDVYSYGIVLWELFMETNYLKNDGSPPIIPDYCPKTLKTLLSKCWSNKPHQRPSISYIIEYINQHGDNLFTKNYEPTLLPKAEQTTKTTTNDNDTINSRLPPLKKKQQPMNVRSHCT